MNTKNGFTTASLVLGVCAIASVFTMTLIPPMVLGGLSIILGLLSRGDSRQLHASALVGIITSASALVINIAIAAFSCYLIFTDPTAREQYFTTVEQTYEALWGVSLEEVLDAYGLSLNR